MDITARVDFAQITETCDPAIDEHDHYHWTGQTRTNEQDLHEETYRSCQCGTKGFWIPTHAAAQYGYTA